MKIEGIKINKPTRDRVITALLIFLTMGTILNAIVSYVQRVETQETLDRRTALFNDIIEQDRTMSEKIDKLIYLVETKLEKDEKTGKLNK